MRVVLKLKKCEREKLEKKKFERKKNFEIMKKTIKKKFTKKEFSGAQRLLPVDFLSFCYNFFLLLFIQFFFSKKFEKSALEKKIRVLQTHF